MRYWLAFLMAFAISAFSADVKPFVFGDTAPDSASQQDEFDYLLKYKLFGRDYLKMGRRVIIPDKSGWNGTAHAITSAEQISLGGTTLAGDSIVLGDACQFTTGPIRALSLKAGNDNGASMFGGTVCLVDTDVSSSVMAGITRAGGTLTGTCPEVPQAPSTLSIPTTDWPTDGYRQDIVLSDNNAVAYIDVPDGEGVYDVYYKNIHTCVDGKNGCTIHVRMQDGGRLTRIFVDSLFIGNHTTFNVVYRTEEGEQVQNQKQYRGNVMFYSNKGITFDNTDNVPIQGTFMTTGKIYLKCNLDFAGQLLANQLEIGDDFKGENFKFVPFDPDTLDIDPELNKHGGLVENDSTVIIPIRLSDTATVDVYFNYCFDLKDGVTVDDFNPVADFPVCGQGTKTVMIPSGHTAPPDTIKVNVKKDTLVEPNDYLVMKISIESGAVLPNNRTDGELKIKIVDADVSRKVALDTTAVYSESENYTGPVDRIKIVNGSDSTRFVLDSSYAGRYSLDSVTGALTLLTPVDYEVTRVDTIKVKLLDTSNTVVVGYIPVSVVDVNESPAITTASITVSENLPVPAKVGKIEWSDPDTGDLFRDNAVEVIVPADGLTVQPDGTVYTTKVFDFEKDPAELVMTVRVYDRNTPSLADTAAVKFVVTNLDESPNVSDTTFHVKENTTGPVGTLVASDPEGKGLMYTIVEQDSGFEIDSAGHIVNTREFDHEKEASKTVHVKVSDGNLVSTAIIKIVIDDVNEPVHTNDTVLTVDEHTTGPIGRVSGEDEDGLPVRFIGTDSVHYNIDSSTGDIRLVTPFDYDVTKEDTLYVVVTDGMYTDTAKVIVRVNNVNEPPALQPNDSLKVPENCGNCIVGIVTAVDPDRDPVTYRVVEPGFTVDSNGVLKLTGPLDYERTSEAKVTVIASDPSGAADTAVYTVRVTDINEPVHARDTTCSVPENTSGNTGCRINAWDDDGTRPTYSIGDTDRYSIDSNGTITVRRPFDYEKEIADTVTVTVTDGEFTDTARLVIRVVDVPEKTEITEVDGQPKQDTVRTNTPWHVIDYRICEESRCMFDSLDLEIHRDTVVKVCNEKKTSCDQVVILFNDAPPLVILSDARSTSAEIDYITIEEQKDGGIYVNRKDNSLKVTIQDTVNTVSKEFNIGITLDTVSFKHDHVREYRYLVDETKAEIIPIGNGLATVRETIRTDGTDVTVSKTVKLSTMEPVDTLQTVSYVTVENGKKVTVSYLADNLSGERIGNYRVSYQLDSCTTVSYELDGNKNTVKNEEGNIGYKVKYDYVDDFGNKASAEVEIIFDNIPPKVEILEPIAMTKFNTNAVKVKWTVNGEIQDTLNLQRLEKGVNYIIRRYVDKAGNVAADTVPVIMNEAKDIDISIIHPVTKVDQDKVDEYYADNKYDPKKPYSVQFTNPDSSKLPEIIGVGFKIDIVLPSVSATGGLATLDDVVREGKIPVDDKGNIVGASTKGIPVEKYVEEHCTDEFQKDFKKNGLNIPLYDVTYYLHLWVFTTQANYVNDFKVEYTLNDQAKVTDAGTVQMVLDWLADRDGNVKAKNHKALGTSSYITKLESKSVAKHRCDYKEQVKGDRTVKKEEDMTIFGYKRPKNR